MTITINDPTLTMDTSNCPAGETGVPYQGQILVNKENPRPLLWVKTYGDTDGLIVGLSSDSKNVDITGTPIKGGDITFEVVVCDGNDYGVC